jgi:AcrR family transcriptional regulator
MTSTPSRLVRPYNGIAADERVAARRQRLLEAGLQCYGTDGYAATGVKDISREAGLTHRYFYESFEDSEALFLAVFDWVMDELLQGSANAVMAAGPDLESQLRASVTAFMTAMADDPRKARVMFSEPTAVGPNAERHMRVAVRRFIDFSQAIGRAHLPSEISDATLRIAAIANVGTLERVVIEWQDGMLKHSLDEIIDDCVRVLIAIPEGLTARSQLAHNPPNRP